MCLHITSQVLTNNYLCIIVKQTTREVLFMKTKINLSEVAIEWLYVHSKKMVSLIERYQKAAGNEEKRNFLRRKIEKEISLQKALLGEKENIREEINGIYDADGEQAKRFDLPKRNTVPIDIVCD